jgi:hypothetical protein
MLVAVERTHHGLADFLLQRQLDLLDHGADHHASGLLGAFGDAAAERHQRADQLHIGLDVLEHLRLEEQLVEPFALDGVLLDDRHDVFLKIRADVSQPLGQPRGRAAQTGGAATGLPLLFRFVVDGGQGLVHQHLLGREGELLAPHAAQRLLRVLAQNQPPAAELLGIDRRGAHKSPKSKSVSSLSDCSSCWLSG